MRLYRLDPKTGKTISRASRCLLCSRRSKAANQKHHAKNKVLVRIEQEMIDLIMLGYSVRMVTGAAPSLVRRNLFVDGKPID